MSNTTTPTDKTHHSDWRISDPLISLRELGSDRTYALPVPAKPDDAGSWDLGTDAERCTIELPDGGRRISRIHARLHNHEEEWRIQNLSKNGTWIGGARITRADLAPGIEIEVGGLTLIAESRQLRDLRALLRRLIGWRDDRTLEVDAALRSLRDAATLRLSLVLCGEGPLHGLAQRFHDTTLGADRPFVIHKPGEPILEEAAAADTGTLFFDVAALPRDFNQVIAEQRRPGSRLRLVIGAPTASRARTAAMALGRIGRIDLPPLTSRGDELFQVMEEYAVEEALRLEVPRVPMRQDDLDALYAHGFDGIEDLQLSMKRLVAIRRLGVTRGAARLDLTHGALSKWALRRNLPGYERGDGNGDGNGNGNGSGHAHGTGSGSHGDRGAGGRRASAN